MSFRYIGIVYFMLHVKLHFFLGVGIVFSTFNSGDQGHSFVCLFLWTVTKKRECRCAPV